jgi:hypothetical protein
VLPASPPMASTGSNQRSEMTGMSQLVHVKIVDFEGRVVVENKEAAAYIQKPSKTARLVFLIGKNSTVGRFD